MLGGGETSTVFLHGNKAVKYIKSEEREKYQREVKAYQMLKGSDNILKFYNSSPPTVWHNGFILMELMEGDHYNKPIVKTYADLVFFIKDLLSGIKYMHEASVAHRDLKLVNLLWKKDNDRVRTKICDFGLSATGYSERVMGTIMYMAPELVFAIETNENRGWTMDQMKRADCYSAGLCIREIVLQKKGIKCESINEYGFMAYIRKKEEWTDVNIIYNITNHLCNNRDLSTALQLVSQC